jgi:hypothetical protein
MSTPTTETAPSYFSFQPASYWDENDPLSAILRNVKGTNRRQMITDYWNAGKIEELEPPLLADDTNPRLRGFLESLHPSFMGGEYLPDLRPTEVEIARIDLQSTTSDVISIRARREPGDELIHYRVVDEYDAPFEIQPESSSAPLTQGELISLLDGTNDGEEGGLAHCYNIMNFNGMGEAERLRHFTTVTSTVYPDLFDHYDAEHQKWCEECSRVEDEED